MKFFNRCRLNSVTIPRCVPITTKLIRTGIVVYTPSVPITIDDAIRICSQFGGNLVGYATISANLSSITGAKGAPLGNYWVRFFFSHIKFEALLIISVYYSL